MKATVMEMEMILAMLKRAALAVEEAQRGLEIQHRDLMGQAEWIKGEIRKAQPETKSTHIDGHAGFPCPECC